MNGPQQRTARLWAFEGAYCYGLDCPLHGDCVRYIALDGATDDRQRIATCVQPPAGRPLYLKESPQ